MTQPKGDVRACSSSSGARGERARAAEEPAGGGGIPLVGHAVRQARRAVDSIGGGPHAVVCTTDDPDIADCAREWGAEVPFLLVPAGLATGTATSVDVAVHALEVLEAAGRGFRVLVLVQPTSPLTLSSDLAAAVARFDADPDHGPVAAVTPTHPAAWHVSGPPGPRTRRGPSRPRAVRRVLRDRTGRAPP